MLKRLLLCLCLPATISNAIARDYTDIYFVATEPGSGYNVVQSDTFQGSSFMFVTFFIYGLDKTPTWYTAELRLDSSGNFTGLLYATTGTFYGSPWNTQDLIRTQVGTASFQPTSAYTATLVYTVTTPPAMAATVTKLLQRQTLTSITLAGTYRGGVWGAFSGCGPGAPYTNGPYNEGFTLYVTQMTSLDAMFEFDYDGGTTCILNGTLTQYGQLYALYGASYTCSDGLKTTANMSEIRATSLGIEGHFAAPDEGGGCGEVVTFGGPFKQ